MESIYILLLTKKVTMQQLQTKSNIIILYLWFKLSKKKVN